MKRILRPLMISLTLAFAAFVSAVLDAWTTPDYYKVTLTLATLAFSHFIFKVVLFYLLYAHLDSSRVRYSIQKVLTISHLLVATLFVLRIWLPDSNTLLAAYGFFAAAIAFAVQDLFKNIIGGIIILLRSPYKVGHRVQIDAAYGDVIDVGILYTTLLEIKEWVSGDQPTGRIVRVANGKVITKDVKNYTSDHSFIWDEIHIPITHESDWVQAEKIISGILQETTNAISMKAMQEISHLRTKYYMQSDDIDPHVYIEITDNWTSLFVRYVVDARRRRSVRDDIMRAIKTAFAKEKQIEIASATSTVTVKK
jgi:small-conductance mechanosensitive channel